jgi:hypothetical protein
MLNDQQMKTSSLPIPSLVLFCLLLHSCAWCQTTTNMLTKAADRALAEGKETTMNVGFARFLGLTAEKPLAVKSIQYDKDGVTNVLKVIRDNPNTILFSERRGLLTTFYLTDRSGILRRAFVNDGAIANGGLTNLTSRAATVGFEKQKLLWKQKTAK